MIHSVEFNLSLSKVVDNAQPIFTEFDLLNFESKSVIGCKFPIHFGKTNWSTFLLKIPKIRHIYTTFKKSNSSNCVQKVIAKKIVSNSRNQRSRRDILKEVKAT